MVVLSSCHHLLVSRLPDSALLVAGTEDTQIQVSALSSSLAISSSGVASICPQLAPPCGQGKAGAATAVLAARRWGGGRQAHVHGSYVLACARCPRSCTMHFVAMQAVAVKGRAATCDNVECPKVDAKNTFCKCGGCSTTLYCSKECQTLAWKQGGYKTMCKMKQCERFEGKSQAISKSDAAFFHHLPICNVRHHLPLLRRLVCSTYLALRSCKLLIRVDYTAVLPAYSVVPLAEMQHREERHAHPRPPLKGPCRQRVQCRVPAHVGCGENQ
ncbi:hypothetical protein B0H14DRAFT_3426124 [Mycena olivaceomarginata]|nr:hypothetical protein B0H14DRAFT_3426124 [Mycena olivaceomarginata]